MLVSIVDKMSIVMLANNGLGLSANQVGLNICLFIMQDGKRNIHAICNPKLISVDGMVTMDEGCLSAPGIFLSIARPESICIEFQNIEGETKRVIAEGIEARTILHEMEHLEGKFYFDQVNRKLRKEAISKLKRSKT